MTWHMFSLTYDLLSPLHIGYQKVGNVQRTRYYVPARNLWGAVTETLTRRGFSTADVPEGDYQYMGCWIQNHLAFSYFFLLDDDNLLYPCYTKDGLEIGNIPMYEFERRYLDSHVTTALDATTTSAEYGSLHEVEYLSPHRLDNGTQTRLRGWVFLDDHALRYLGTKEKWRQWLGEISIGGERRYGFGHLRLQTWDSSPQPPDGYEVQLHETRPYLKCQAQVKEPLPLLAHTLVANVQAKGIIEPVVRRETKPDGSHLRETQQNSSRFGQTLTPAHLCWVPGSMVDQETSLKVTIEGLWASIDGEKL